MTSNQVELTQELSTNFINYAMAVNTDRSIPDATTGLKPVHKRILYCALDDGNISNKKHVKCANIVGSMLANWHPHGDTSVYDALVRLAQPWVMRYPLIDFHGNCGNQIGDGPAHYRYTECRLAKLAEDGILEGVKRHCVDFQPNFDETKEEPVSLPAVFPNLLCNPNSGIGVALACSWAPHNLREVAAAINDYLDGKEPMLLGADFPTGAQILNKDDVPKIMQTGKGTLRIRAKYLTENNSIVFYEIPYGVTIEKIIQELNELADADKRLVFRARKLKNFFSQPFFVASSFTGMQGRYVPLARTIASCRAILDGKCDEIPEEQFFFIGDISEICPEIAL